MKELSKKFGAILVMKGNEPDVIIMDYKKYLEIESSSESTTAVASGTISAPTTVTPVPSINPKQVEEERTLIDNLNKEIQSLNQEIEAQTNDSSDTSDDSKPSHEPVMV